MCCCVIVIHIYLKFHGILVIRYLVMTNLFDFKPFKGNNSCTSDASLTKHEVHLCLTVIYIYITIGEVPGNDYLEMAPNGREKTNKNKHRKTGEKTDRQKVERFGRKELTTLTTMSVISLRGRKLVLLILNEAEQSSFLLYNLSLNVLPVKFEF